MISSANAFAYEMQALSNTEMKEFITRKWDELALPLSTDDGVSIAISRIAAGNLRILHRVFAEIKRLQKLNCLTIITPDVVEVLRKGLLLGSY